MSTRATNTLAAVALIAIAACSNDASMGSAPKAPPPPQVLGTIMGTVSGQTMTAVFTPAGAQAGAFGEESPNIYGGSATVHVTGTFVSMVDVPGVSRTWTFSVQMRNLLSYAIGANYSASNPAPADTSGVFVVFSSLPTVTLPIPCSGCTVNVTNAMGKGNFDKIGEPYFWYLSRPTAVQGSPSTDTTSATNWVFKTTAFTAPDTAHAFTFVLVVGAAWPPPNEPSATWTVIYDGTADSLPESQAEPRWRRFAATSTAVTLGTDAFVAGAGLDLNNINNTHSIYLARHDSLGTNTMHVDARVRLFNVSANTIQAVLGFAEPSGGGRKQLFIGIASNRVSFVNFNQGTGQWAVNGSTFNGGGLFNGTAFHTYRLRKLGTSDAHLCVDGIDVGITRTYPQMQGTTADFANSSVAFGSDGRAGGAISEWSSVNYTIGNDAGSCT